MPVWNFAGIWSSIARVAPERTAVVCGDHRLTYGGLDDRARRLASHLFERGLRPGDKVAIDLVNRPEYLETFFAASLLGCVPVNVNYRYVAEELAYLLGNADAAALVVEPAFAAVAREAVASMPVGDRPLVLETGSSYEDAIGAAAPVGAWDRRPPSADDLVFLYTGGTTGMPKGVMWRHEDLYLALWEISRPGVEPKDPLALVSEGKRAATSLPASPLMHGTSLFVAITTLAGGGTVVLLDHAHLDPVEIWDAVARERVQILSIVGDVFARPLLAALDAEPNRWDLGSIGAITSSGVTWSPDTKRGLLRHLPDTKLLDSLGASEGLMTRSVHSAGDAEIRPARFAITDRLRVVTDDGRFVEPGSGEIGLVAVGGHIPLGYYKDPEKSAATFRTVAGTRFSIPGDHATVETDGTITLLGRGSACINTGGEKVYPEEIEGLLRSCSGVLDCVVVGVPDERFGERVVALVQAAGGHDIDETALVELCREHLAGYKRPKQFVFLESLHRSAAGKANYKLLRELAVERTGS
ncbi:MAG: AMP-binding protein [Acidimicrobiia bacterium]